MQASRRALHHRFAAALPSHGSSEPYNHAQYYLHRNLLTNFACHALTAAVLQSLADAVDAGDVDAFTTAVAEFDSLTRLDAWKTALLVRVKRKIGTRDELDEEDLT